MPCRMLKKAASKATASEEARRTLQYVEPLSDARTPLAGVFSILLALDLRRLVMKRGDLRTNEIGKVFVP
jgi:hypothetical protein